MDVSISGYSQNSVQITGLTRDEVDHLIKAFRGLSWFSVEGGRLQTSSRFAPLPDPVRDEEMIPFWRQYSNTQAQGEFFPKVFEDMSPDVVFSPHITIQSLCGYNYTPENYARESTKLLSYGFRQIRSQRGEDGGYWELWYLPGVWCAKGDLKDVVERTAQGLKPSGGFHIRQDDKECFEAAVDFLRRNISFGTLDVSVQRWAMATPD